MSTLASDHAGHCCLARPQTEQTQIKPSQSRPDQPRAVEQHFDDCHFECPRIYRHGLAYDDMISGPMGNTITTHQDLYSGLIRLHILHHASQGEVFGLWLMEELGRHGYRLSAGTMYPLLHSLEKRGFLISQEKREGKRYRRLYRITPTGRTALLAAKKKVSELFGELFEHKRSTQRSKRKRRS